MRRHELDGLRAVAATMVVLFHCLVAMAKPHELTAALHLGPAGAIANGESAVVLFFVLSGYVLARSFLRDSGARGTVTFLVRRVMRLYPAWIAALLATWLASFAYPSLPRTDGLSSSMQKSLAVHLSGGELLRSLAVPGVAFGQLPPGWSLALELQLSFVLPVLAVIALRGRVAAVLVLAIAGLAISDRPVVLHAFPFVLGLALAMCGSGLPPWSPAGTALAGVAAAFAFFLPPGWLWPVSPALGVAVASVGAVVIVALVLQHRTLARMFAAPWLVRIGERSYGLYLFHFAIVCLAAPFVVGDTPASDMGTAVARWLALAAIVMPMSLACAFASWRWIERPSIALGQRLTALIEARAH